MSRAALLAVLILTVAPIQTQSADRCQVHVILFVPEGVKQPTGYQRRIDEIVAYAEAFFERELARWEHEKIVKPFCRTKDGRVEVTMIRGKKKTSEYKPVPVRMEVMDFLRRKGKIDDSRQIWWIMVYAGEPPARFPGYLGGFGQEIGGWAVCNFDTTAGRIDPAVPLGSAFLEKLTLKGMIHELGHGFGLPHVGPLERDGVVNTLMGPTHINFRKVKPRGAEQVRLSEAEAAMFSAHPAFRGASDHREPLPKVDVQNLKYSVNARDKTISVSGKVQSGKRALFALVADESDERPGEYWTKTYVGKVASDGSFSVTISEPSQSNGTLKTWFVFEGGVQTGDGRSRGREGGLPKKYTYSQKRWSFQ
jgi:hypothetical protein